MKTNPNNEQGEAMIITMDGPAGSGKSSLSKQVAKNLGFEVLDTGAMYRSLAYLTQKNVLKLDTPEFSEFLENFHIEFKKGRILANGEDVTDFIRTPEMDLLTSQYISVNPLVRSKMHDLQRKAAVGANIVAEGRDMGSHVFPDAELKLYLDARVDVRAKRRQLELKERGIIKNLIELEEEIKLRDLEDSSREFSPLSIPDNAEIIDTSEFNPQEVLELILNLYQKNILHK